MGGARDLVKALRWGGEPYGVLGPAPAPLNGLKGEHRAQLFIKGSQRAAMRKALLSALDARPDIKRRTIVDVDAWLSLSSIFLLRIRLSIPAMLSITSTRSRSTGWRNCRRLNASSFWVSSAAR